MNMPTKNIFAGFGVRSEFVNLIYTELMKREFVSYTDILALYCKRPKGYYDKKVCNREPGYGELKKAFPEVLKALEMACPGCIEDNGQNKGKAFGHQGGTHIQDQQDPESERTFVLTDILESNR